MRLLVVGVALLTGTALAAAPVLPTIATRLDRIETRIETGIRDGGLDPREARELRRAFRDLAARKRRYAEAGMTTRELNDLTRRVDRLSARVATETTDREVR